MTTRNVEYFENLIADSGVVLTPALTLEIIEAARQLMLNGETTVEAFYAAKRALVERCVMESEAIN